MTQAVNKSNGLADDATLQYMSLSLGNVRLLARQSEIAAVESLQDILFDKPSKGAVGWINFEGHDIPVYSFTERLGIEHSLSQDKTICAVLADERDCIGLMCSEVAPFSEQIVKMQSLPECMQSSPCPIECLCLYKEADKRGINYTVTARSITYFINRYDDQ